ncbi:MAG: hypothetical protein AB4911_09960 [Oscillochloridaceae bacterium umkhey_bin13]
MNYELLLLLGSPQGLIAALILIFLAGLSEGAGTRGVVLLINRITPLGFALSLLAAALLFVLSAVLWAGGIWLASDLFFGLSIPPSSFFVALSAAYAPLLLGVLALLPLIGTTIRVLLRLWSFLIALAVLISLGLSLWQAPLAALMGTLLVSGAAALVGEPVARAWYHLRVRLGNKPTLREEVPQVIPGYQRSPDQEQGKTML